MPVKNTWVLILMLMVSVWSYGQHKVRGSVVDAETELPLAFAKIVFNNADLSTSTDANGLFAFESKEPLTSLVCTAKDYEDYIIQLRKRNVSVHIQMTPIRAKTSTPANRD